MAGLRKQLRTIREVHHISCWGDFDAIRLVRAAIDNIDLRRVIFDQLQSVPGVLDTQTFLVFEDLDTDDRQVMRHLEITQLRDPRLVHCQRGKKVADRFCKSDYAIS